MEKAFDPKDLVQKLKGGGLDIAEDAAKHIVESVFAWVGESVVLSPSKYDDLVLVVLPALKDLALKEVDKIDGKVG